MPKANPKKRNSASQSSPYAQAAAKTKAANNIFKMNTDMGQHVLKNPGVAQAIVDKADLKQSDVRSIHSLILLSSILFTLLSHHFKTRADSVTHRSYSRSVLDRGISQSRF